LSNYRIIKEKHAHQKVWVSELYAYNWAVGIELFTSVDVSFSGSGRAMHVSWVCFGLTWSLVMPKSIWL